MRKLFRKVFPKKELRPYRKMYRKQRKRLITHAQTIREWDYGFLHDSVMMQIEHMYEYYTTGSNVFQSDESLNVILEQLKHILDLNYELEHVWDNHESGIVKNKDGSLTVTDEAQKRYADLRNKEHALYEEIYTYIGKNIEWWWD
jgi:hypothetical protein